MLRTHEECMLLMLVLLRGGMPVVLGRNHDNMGVLRTDMAELLSLLRRDKRPHQGVLLSVMGGMLPLRSQRPALTLPTRAKTSTAYMLYDAYS